MEQRSPAPSLLLTATMALLLRCQHLAGKKPICQQTLTAAPPAELKQHLGSGAHIHRGNMHRPYHVDLRAPLLSSGEADDFFRFPRPSCFHGLLDRKAKTRRSGQINEIDSAEEQK